MLLTPAKQGRQTTICSFSVTPGRSGGEGKALLDSFRQTRTLPPEVGTQIDGTLFPNQRLLDLWRDWRRGIGWYDASLNARMMGAIDDLLLQGNRHVPLDYKSRGSAPTPEAASFHQTQIDCYGLLLERNGYSTNGVGYLLFYYPTKIVSEAALHLRFVPFEMITNPDRAMHIFKEAVSVLRAPAPKSSDTCKFCAWADKVSLQNFAL